ncbi:MAG TPA: hypothetical protein ENF81_06320 [Thermotogaceae bacterium]|nr:MAG: hypothetical protein DRI88_09555 [Bacteroidota bacterium]RLD74708.1 MAG: hypothetical protein DRI87_00095 [Bacteroidota bacterium]RLD86695.1 MAG: hypothetical protein DRJ02_08175 [Bacteroidota bacterium]HEW92138.1 hypothetical protein [Thermotogaceae bacterium]
MIEYSTNKGGIKIQHKLYAKKIKVSDGFKIVNYNYVRGNFFAPLFIKKHRYTLLVDLTQNEEVIFQHFKPNTRNKIRRAVKNEVVFDIETNLKEFITFYNEFALKKGQAFLSYESFQQLKPLTLTKAMIHDQTLVMHAHITDKKANIARMINSASVRLEKGTNTNLAGWANRFLHYQDMLYFKRKGVITYDFGGTAHHTKKKDNHEIDRFKMEFGGRIIDEYFYESIPHYLALNLNKVFSSVIRRKSI